MLLKNLQKLAGIECRGILTASGQSAVSAGNRYGFAFCTSEVDEILSDTATDAVFIATRHSQHADLVLRALQAGKAVFVEKPLAVNAEQFEIVKQAVVRSSEVLEHPSCHPPSAIRYPPSLMVGFNRRFAPMAVALKQHFAVSIRCI